MATTDYGAVGTALALVTIAFLQVWNTARSSKRDSAIAVMKTTGEDTARKVEEVHKLTNGGMSDQLQIGMVAAKALAALTHLPEHLALAEIATKKYEAHVEALRLADIAAALAVKTAADKTIAKT